jgi:hypothetical protein
VPPGKSRPALRLSVASATSGRPPEPLPPVHPLVETWRDAAGGACAFAYESAGRFWMDWPGIARFSFDLEGHQITAWPEPDASPADIERVHRRVVVPAACQRLGHAVLHASAVRTPHGVIGFCGEAGAGKSTFAFALAARGCDHWADDTLVIDPGAVPPLAVPIPFDAALRPLSADYLLGVHGVHQGKVTCAAGGPERLAALVLLQRTDAAARMPRAEQLRPVAALEQLLSHACAFSTRTTELKRILTEHYLALADAVPVLTLTYASGFDALGAALDLVLDVTGHPGRDEAETVAR